MAKSNLQLKTMPPRRGLYDKLHGYKRYALHERGMRPRSYKSIVASVRMLSEFAETDDLSQFGQGTVKAFLYWGREERAWEARTFRNHWAYLHSFFKWCAQQGYIKQNPVDGIEKPKLPKRLPRCLSRDEMQAVLNEVRWHPWRYKIEGVRNEAILYTLVYTGLRLQELLNLENQDVDLDGQELLVRQGKGQKDRMVPIHPRLSPILRRYIGQQRQLHKRSLHFFTGVQSEKRLTGKDIRTICRRVSRAVGVDFTPHMLRHTFGRLAVEAGLDIFTIKEIMGHSEISTTQGYLSVSVESMKENFGELTLL